MCCLWLEHLTSFRAVANNGPGPGSSRISHGKAAPPSSSGPTAWVCLRVLGIFSTYFTYFHSCLSCFISPFCAKSPIKESKVFVWTLGFSGFGPVFFACLWICCNSLRASNIPNFHQTNVRCDKGLFPSPPGWFSSGHSLGQSCHQDLGYQNEFKPPY